MQEAKRKQKCQRQCRGGPPPKCGAAAGLHTRRSNESEDGASDEEETEIPPPPLHVFFDVEAMQLHKRHVPNLIVTETEDDEQRIRFKGEHCDFIEWLDTLTRDDTQQVNVLAHNFEGYDGYFIVHEYHGKKRILKQLRNGAKLLEVVHDNIRFIDSMSFFQMPLATFPKSPPLLHARNQVVQRPSSS